ncbi:hypothetical protein DPSP01_012789 [Paraphaeosphaeria sporulosa]
MTWAWGERDVVMAVAVYRTVYECIRSALQSGRIISITNTTLSSLARLRPHFIPFVPPLLACPDRFATGISPIPPIELYTSIIRRQCNSNFKAETPRAEA